MKGVVQVMVKYTPDILHVMETQNCSIKRLVFKFQCIIFVVVVVGIYFKFPGYKNGVPGMMKMCIKDWTWWVDSWPNRIIKRVGEWFVCWHKSKGLNSSHVGLDMTLRSQKMVEISKALVKTYSWWTNLAALVLHETFWKPKTNRFIPIPTGLSWCVPIKIIN